LVDRIDTLARPVVLTVFVENYSNEGGIDQPVRFSPWVDPVAVRGLKMRGGTFGAGAAGFTAGVLRPGLDTAGPCWWRASFVVRRIAGFGRYGGLSLPIL